MILLDSVTKQYPGDPEPALDSVSLHIEPNEFVFLVGKSGAGKSTLMKMITKEENPDSGKIIIGGIDLDYVKKRHIPGYRRRLGVVFQDFKLLPKRTVYENVAFALEIAGMSGKEIRNTVPKVLELVDLLDQAKKFPHQLSGGQQQRVSIARSVARQPKILIADEPTANLDKLTTKEIIDLLKKINDFGTTILVTTHNENIVNNLQKRVITLKNGKIVNDQKANGIYRLDETPVPPVPVRKIQEPGHALRPGMITPIVQPTPRVINNGVAGVSPSLASRQMAKQPAARTLAKTPAQQARAVTTQSSRAVFSRAPRNASKANMRVTSKSPTRTATKQSRLGVNRKVM